MDRRTVRHARGPRRPSKSSPSAPPRASAARFAGSAGALTAQVAEALVADPDVEVVRQRRAQAHRACPAGVAPASACAKPMGLDAAQAEEVSAAAATAGVLCMEAMWTLFLPRFDVVRQVLEQGLLGEVGRCWPTTASGSNRPTGSSTCNGGRVPARPRQLPDRVGDLDAGPGPGRVRHRRMTPSGVNGQAAMS